MQAETQGGGVHSVLQQENICTFSDVLKSLQWGKLPKRAKVNFEKRVAARRLRFSAPVKSATVLVDDEPRTHDDCVMVVFNDYMILASTPASGTATLHLLFTPYSLMTLVFDPKAPPDVVRLLYGDYTVEMCFATKEEEEDVMEKLREALKGAARATIGRLGKQKSTVLATTFRRASTMTGDVITKEEEQHVDQHLTEILNDAAPIDSPTEDKPDKDAEKDTDRGTAEENTAAPPAAEEEDKLEYFSVPGDSAANTSQAGPMLVNTGEEKMVLQFVHSELLLMAATRGKLLEYLTSTRVRGYLYQAPKKGMLKSLWRRKAGTKSLLTRATDLHYLETFLLTYRLHMTPHDLMDGLRARFEDPLVDLSAEDAVQENAQECRTKILNVVMFWVRHYWLDHALDESLREKLEAFLDEMEEHGHPKFVKELQSNIEAQEKLWVKRTKEFMVAPKRDKSGPLASILLTVKPEELAMQITLFDAALFRNIAPVEFLNNVWKEKHKAAPLDGCSYTGNLDRLIARFNQESNWVAAEITSQEGVKNQTTMVIKFIQVAQHCLHIQNLYSVFAVVGALGSPKVRKLKEAWDKVPKKLTKAMKRIEDTIMNPSKNMKYYRGVLSKFERKPDPVLPMIPIFLKDLYFLNEGNDEVVEDTMTNFDKLRMISQLVQDLTVRTAKPYGESPDKGWQGYLQVACVSED